MLLALAFSLLSIYAAQPLLQKRFVGMPRFFQGLDKNSPVATNRTGLVVVAGWLG